MEEQSIKIVGVIKESIREHATVKNGWILPFKLSEKPNDSWERNFFEVHRKSTNPKKKEVKLIKDYIEVQVVETDNQQQVLEVLNEEVTTTNEVYRDIYLKKMQMQDDLKVQQLRQQGVLQKLKDDSDQLKF